MPESAAGAEALEQRHASAAREPRSRLLIHGINFYPEFIGVGKYTGDLAFFLASRGHDVEVVTAPPHYPGWQVRVPHKALRYHAEIIRGVAVRRCPIITKKGGAGIWRLIAPLSFAVFAAPVAFWRILRMRPHAVLCVEPTLLTAPAVLLAGKLVGANCVLHVQDLEIDAAFEMGPLRGDWTRSVCAGMERALLRRFDRIVTISGKMREALIRKGVDARRIEVVRNWVDPEAVSAQPRALDNPFRAQLHLKPTDHVALYAGHLGSKQALPVLLDTARSLSHEPNVVVVIAGEGPARQQLLAEAADLPNVRFLPLQPPERLSHLLNLADVHVLPQDRMAADLVLPSKLGPMLASGRPIAVTADAGTELAEMLDGIAIVVPAGNGELLAGAIQRALSADVSDQIAKGRVLAASLARDRVLPVFEDVLIGPSDIRSADASGEIAHSDGVEAV